MGKLRLFFAILLVCIPAVLCAQTVKVSGKVVDAKNGEAVAFCSIQIKGTMNGGSSDADGNFSINVPSNGILIISSIGYHSVEVPVDGRTYYTVVLEQDSEMLNETIVVAFGQTTKEAFTGSASVVKSDDLAKRQTANVANALVGQVAGLQIRGNSGAPGSSGGNINIRGIGSLYADTAPLVVVDGAPYSASLSNIPQSDIESITVLKDAASAALYGARGASGVILVTTKKGRANNATINVDMKLGVNSKAVQEYDIITDPGQYYEAYYSQLYNMYYYGQGMLAADADAKANATMLSDLQYNVFTYPDTENLIVNGKLNPNATPGRKVTLANGEDLWMQSDNWNDAAYKNSLRQEYTVSVNGNVGKMNYYMSLAHLDEDGIVDYSNYKRTTARLKVDYQARKWLKVGANVGYVNSAQNLNYGAGTELSSTNLFYFTSGMAPIYPIYVRTLDSNGNPVIKTDSYGNPMYDYGIAAKSYGVTRPFLAQGNPLGVNRYNETSTTGNQLNGTFDAEVKLCDFLKANVTSTVIWGGSNATEFGNMLYGPSSASNGSIGKSYTTTLRTNNVQTLTYFDTFGKHNVNVMAGHEYYSSTTNYLYGHGIGMFSNDIKEINASATKDDAGSYTSKYNVEGYFLSAQYDYAQKYYLSASYRRDASSYFAQKNRWGDFWSVGGAWIISKENFMSNTSDWLDMLKFKASVGQQGNDGVGPYKYVDTYSLIKATENSMSVSFRSKGNEDITWETTTNTNVGLEFSFLKGRLSGNIDYYNKKTTDLLFWLSIPESSGTRGMYGNIGDIRNQGVELVLNATLVRTNLVDWSVYGNISHNQTKILSLPESKILDQGGFEEAQGQVPMWYKVGGPLYNAYMVSYAGVDEYGQAQFYVDTKDENGNTIVKGGKTYDFNEATKYETGTLLPMAFGGFGTTLRVAGFDLSVTFDYQIGGKVFDFRYRSLMAPAENSGAAGNAIHKDYIKSWSPDNTASTMPRWQYGDKYGAARSDRFLTSASYLDFQSFAVGYTFPEKWFKNKLKMRIYAAGENLYFWSARKGLDPRYAYQGTSSSGVNSYSPIRTISGGLQLTF